jgi:hypothetical protein
MKYMTLHNPALFLIEFVTDMVFVRKFETDPALESFNAGP